MRVEAIRWDGSWRGGVHGYGYEYVNVDGYVNVNEGFSSQAVRGGGVGEDSRV